MFYTSSIVIKQPPRGNKKEEGKICVLVITELGRIRKWYAKNHLDLCT